MCVENRFSPKPRTKNVVLYLLLYDIIYIWARSNCVVIIFEVKYIQVVFVKCWEPVKSLQYRDTSSSSKARAPRNLSICIAFSPCKVPLKSQKNPNLLKPKGLSKWLKWSLSNLGTLWKQVLEQGTAIHPIPIHHIAFISCSVDEMESSAPLTDSSHVLPQSS